MIKEFRFELREVSKFFPKVKAAVYSETHGKTCYEYSLFGCDSLNFSLRVFVPILIGLEIHDSVQRRNFVDGKFSEPLISIAEQVDVRLFSELLADGESFDPNDKQHKYIKLEDRLKRLYCVVFGNVLGDATPYEQVGQLTFREDIKERIIRAAGLLTDYSDYTV